MQRSDYEYETDAIGDNILPVKETKVPPTHWQSRKLKYSQLTASQSN